MPDHFSQEVCAGWQIVIDEDTAQNRALHEFIMGSWYLAEKRMDMQACIRMAYRYAREVEHSDENLNLLEEWLYHIM